MTFLDVLDDAVKIGLGGFIGWLISKTTRSHEFEKERRRRKQDCLERVIEDLDEQQFAFYDWYIASMAYHNLKTRNASPATQAKALTAFTDGYQTQDRALTKLIRSQSKLIMFGFDECATALRAYYEQTMSVGGKVHDLQQGQMKAEDFAPFRTDLLTSADSFRSTITKAFATL